jgi:serine/threonine-protein kinase
VKIEPGTLLLGRYTVLSVLGHGGMSTVYLAEHVELNRKVAIKILSEELSTNIYVVRRFRAEARTAASVGHPNIVQTFDAGMFTDGRLYLVMEYIEGVDLRHEIVAHRSLDPLRACEIAVQVALALQAVHALGIIHRDLKPGNIILTADGHGGELVKVLDFGIAANPKAATLNGERLTQPGSVMGTPEYMAPEQATGVEPKPAFDIYALGVILHEMLTGALPLTARHSFELLMLKNNQPAPSLRERAPGLPASLIALVDDCLKIDPGRRPPDVAAVVERLRAVIAEPRGAAGPALAQGRGVTLWAMIAVFAVGTIALLVALYGRLSRDPTAEVAPADAVPVVPEPSPPPEVPAPAVVPAEPAPVEPAKVEPVKAKPAKTASRTRTSGRASAGPAPSGAPAAVAEPAGRGQVVGDGAAQAPEPAAAPAHTTSRCVMTRKSAEEARQTHRWLALRSLSREVECWEDADAARKLQVQARLETGDYEGCISLGADIKDAEVASFVKLCRLRANEG